MKKLAYNSTLKKQKTWHLIPSLQGKEREKMEAMTDFLFLGSKFTVGGDCSHEIKRHMLSGRKTMTNLDSILKSRDITLLTKVHLAKAISSSHARM